MDAKMSLFEDALEKNDFFRNAARFSCSAILSEHIKGDKGLIEHLRLLTEQDGNSTVDEPTVEDTKNRNKQTCLVCSIQFDSRDDQVEHFKTNWHRINVKRKIQRKVPLSEEECDALFSESDEVSTSSSSDDSDSDSGRGSLNRKLATFLQPDQCYFCAKDGNLYSLHRCLVFGPTRRVNQQLEDGELDERLRSVGSRRKWAIFLMAAGRFAGAVFDGNRVVVHKTLQRYTTRRKQGGSQAARDAQQSQHAPKSAGAQLRRHNEAALAQEIRDVLSEWAEHINQAQLVFLRCSTYHRHIFFSESGKQSPALQKDDLRLRTIPFTTRRPTFEEVQRIHRKLCAVICHGFADEFVNNLKTSLLAAAKSSDRAIVADAPRNEQKNFNVRGNHKERSKQSENEQTDKKSSQEANMEPPRAETEPNTTIDAPHVSAECKMQLYTALKSGNVDELVAAVDLCLSRYTKAHVLSYFDKPLGSEGLNVLHLAARSNSPALVRYFLEFGCDPTVKTATKSTGSQLVAYQLASNKPTRREFIEFRRSNEQSVTWNWAHTQIPEPLDQETEQSNLAREAEKRKALRQARKNKQKEKKAVEKEEKAEQKERDRFLALSDREKRAVAAERRLLATCVDEQRSAPVCSRCFACGIDMTGKVPFEYSDNRFCSVRCVKDHRSKGDGAQK